MKNLQTGLLGLFLILSLIPAAQAAGQVKIRNAWIPAAPPVADVMAGYFEIDNQGNKPVVIEGVSCPAFNNAMMHKTIEKNGMSTMIHMDHVTVKPHSKVIFQPGGLHVMLMSPKHPLKVGDKATLILHMKNKKTIHFTAVVKAGGAE